MKWVWTGGCLALMIILYLIYESIKWGSEAHKRQEWFLKDAAPGMAALLAGYGYFSRPSAASLFILIGLGVCVAADVILDLHFFAGTAAFGLGHICYCAAMLLSNKPGWINLIVFILLAGGVCVLYPQIRKLESGKSALLYLGYALLIGAMLALSIGPKPLLTLGAVLFVASDAMLLFRIVKHIPSKSYDYLCLGCYYLAQFLIAASTVF